MHGKGKFLCFVFVIKAYSCLFVKRVIPGIPSCDTRPWPILD